MPSLAEIASSSASKVLSPLRYAIRRPNRVTYVAAAGSLVVKVFLIGSKVVNVNEPLRVKVYSEHQVVITLYWFSLKPVPTTEEILREREKAGMAEYCFHKLPFWVYTPFTLDCSWCSMGEPPLDTNQDMAYRGCVTVPTYIRTVLKADRDPRLSPCKASPSV